VIRGDLDQRQIWIRGDIDLRNETEISRNYMHLMTPPELVTAALHKAISVSLKVQQKRSRTGCNIFMICVFVI